MLARSFLSLIVLAGVHSPQAAGDGLTEVEAAGGHARVHMESPAREGTALFCEYEVRDVHLSERWIPLIAINLDEGGMTDQDSKFVQLDMQFLSDEDGTIMHAFSTGGFAEDFEEPFLMHWQKMDWYSFILMWEGDGVFRYQANVGGGIVGAGMYFVPEFDPKFFRVVVSGLHAGLSCELE